MANTGTGYTEKGSNLLPIPILSLGENYTLQHRRSEDFNTFIAGTYGSSPDTQGGGLSQDGTTWANDRLKVGVSFMDGDWDFWLENKPMVFIEVLNRRAKSNDSKRPSRPQWTHPVSIGGALNRTTTNYGGGDANGLITEWDMATPRPFVENIIEIVQQSLYTNTSISLPQRWVDFVLDSGNQLRFQRGYYRTPTGNWNYVLNTFTQPIRFRFACIDPNDGRSIILGNPSEELVISPKWGHFNPQNDTYIYDWQIRHHG